MTEFKILETWGEIKYEIINKYLQTEINNQTNKLTSKINTELYLDINQRLDFKLYKKLNNNSVINTLKYIFYKIRAGIFIKIENNKLVAFIPFANKYFKNNWYKNIALYNSKNIKEYKIERLKYYKYHKKYIYNIKNWWANASIINNELYENVWGQHSLIEYYNILNETLQNNKIQNSIFFINKRDHPILHGDLTEPYPSLYNLKNKKIEKEYQFKNFAPILSPYSNKYYLDIPFIIPQDWQLANDNKSYYEINENIEWNKKIPIAIFRGSATGSIEPKFNQRLQISIIDYNWKQTDPDLLDAGIVSWNSRDKIDSKKQLNFIKPLEMNKLGIYLKNKIPMNEQIKYKYIINIDGHSKPNRTSYLLQTGSLMLVVESKNVIGNISWFDSLLKPYMHYIPIKSDLSDLKDIIIWCKNNDDKCYNIVQNAEKLYKEQFNKDKILEYSSYLLNQIGNNY